MKVVFPVNLLMLRTNWFWRNLRLPTFFRKWKFEFLNTFTSNADSEECAKDF